jgi:hypothetical protein
VGRDVFLFFNQNEVGVVISVPLPAMTIAAKLYFVMKYSIAFGSDFLCRAGEYA